MCLVILGVGEKGSADFGQQLLHNAPFILPSMQGHNREPLVSTAMIWSRLITGKPLADHWAHRRQTTQSLIIDSFSWGVRRSQFATLLPPAYTVHLLHRKASNSTKVLASDLDA